MVVVEVLVVVDVVVELNELACACAAIAAGTEGSRLEAFFLGSSDFFCM